MANLQAKEDFPEKTHHRIQAVSIAFNIPEDELWEDLFRIAREFDSNQTNQQPEETLLSFTLPKTQ